MRTEPQSTPAPTTLLLLAAILLLGFHPLLRGADFLVYGDTFSVFSYQLGNAVANGWRMDMGLGMSSFIGDPGVHHQWSVYSLVQGLDPANPHFYTAAVLLLFLAAAWAVQRFLARHLSLPSGPAAALLAGLVVFNSLQHECYFARHWIPLAVMVPAMLSLLYAHYRRPNRHAPFLFALLLFFGFFFGSYVCFSYGLATGGLFTLLYAAYHGRGSAMVLWRYLKLAAFGVAATVLLGMWCFYSLGVELASMDYVRDVGYFAGWSIPDLHFLKSMAVGLLHCGWLPYGTFLPGPFTDAAPYLLSIENVSAVFPAVFLVFLLRRSRGFWEFTAKWLLVGLLANEALHWLVPGYGSLLLAVFKGFPYYRFQTVYHFCQIVLLACWVRELSARADQARPEPAPLPARLLAGLLAGFYLLLLLCGAALHVAGPWLVSAHGPELASAFIPAVSGLPRDQVLATLNLLLEHWSGKFGWQALGFYALTVAALSLVVLPRTIRLLRPSPALLLALLLLSANLFQTWAMSPMNTRPLQWRHDGTSEPFAPQDRTLIFASRPERTLVNAVFDNSGDPEAAREILDYIEPHSDHRYPPTLNLSHPKSFNPADVERYLRRIFGPGHLRSMWHLGLARSPLLDLAAVSLYQTRNYDIPEKPLRSGLTLRLIVGDAVVFDNPRAFPYFYLAERVEEYDREISESAIAPGTVFLPVDEAFRLPEGAGNGRAEMTEFGRGAMAFEVSSATGEFLVVSDAWHPNWTVTLDGEPARVILCNEVFKGVAVPPGEHGVRFVFNTAPYRPGVLFSIAAWALFLGLWVRTARKGRSRAEDPARKA